MCSPPGAGNVARMSNQVLVMTMVLCSCAAMPGGPEVDGGGPSMAMDAGLVAADAGTDAGLAAMCSGSGACSALSATQCQFALGLGCVAVRTSSCSQRGLCTGAAAQQNAGACRVAGACVWDGGCAFDPLCPSRTVQQTCLAANCTWVEQVTSCTGSWNCAALFVDGGTASDCVAFANVSGLACR